MEYPAQIPSEDTVSLHIYVSAKIHFDTFYGKQDITANIFHVRNNHCLTNQMFFDYHVASFSSTHSKTRQSDVIGCREHRRRDHGSTSTLMPKLLKTLQKKLHITRTNHRFAEIAFPY